MNLRSGVLSGLVFAFCYAGATAAQRAPVDLSEMPTVERVLQDFQGTDPRDTAFRQMGALWELRMIMDTLIGSSYQAFGHTPYAPDNVKQLDKAYSDAAWKIDRSFITNNATLDEMKKFDSGKKHYRHQPDDPQFGQELFKKYFSPAFRARFNQALANPKAAAEAAAGEEPVKPITNDDEALAALKQLTKDLSSSKNKNDQAMLAQLQPLADAQSGAELKARLLAPAPRPTNEQLLDTAITAVGNFMANDKQISAALAALRGGAAAPRKPIPQGLRLNGEYAGDQGLHMAFTAESAIVTIGQLSLADEYRVEREGAQVFVTVQNGNYPLKLVLNSDGTLSGSGELEITGQVVVGHHTQTSGGGPVTQSTMEQRTLTPLEAGQYSDAVQNGQTYTVNVPVTTTSDAAPSTISVPDYASKTERCAVGILRPVTKS